MGGEDVNVDTGVGNKECGDVRDTRLSSISSMAILPFTNVFQFLFAALSEELLFADGKFHIFPATLQLILGLLIGVYFFFNYILFRLYILLQL